MSVVVHTALIVLGGILTGVGLHLMFGRWQLPRTCPPIAPYTPPLDSLVQAHLHMRDLAVVWRADMQMWAVTPARIPQHAHYHRFSHTGFVVLVSEYATSDQWLNAMDAFACSYRLRSDTDPDIMSTQNIATPPAAPVLITKSSP